jgi:hypothetical protein
MITTLRIHARAFRDDDSGVAMVTVMGVIALMTIISVTAFYFASQNLKDSTRVQRQTQAFQAANSGIDQALARIQANGYRTNDYPVTGTSSTNATFTATVAPTANSEYICTAIGTDASGQTETIKVKFFYLNMWNMNLAGGTNNALGGGSVKGTTSVYGPFYVRGGVALGSNSTIERGPLFIKGGDLTLSGSGSIGGIGAIDVYVTGAYPTPGSRGMNSRSVSQSVPDISLPVVDLGVMQADYDSAKTESSDNVQGYPDSGIPNRESTSGIPSTYQSMFAGWTRPKAPGASSYYKVIGADDVIGALAGGTHPLTIGGTGSWGSYYGDGHYTLPSHDDFCFNDTTNVLTVEGTVFIDGPLTINEAVTYQGNGAIVCNGDITINGNLLPATSDSHPDAAHVVGLVTPGNMIVNAGDNNVKDPEGVPNIAGAFFTSKDFSMTKNVLVKGSVLAGSISFAHPNQHLVTDPNLPSYLPRGMPGAGNSILTKGSWVR